MKPRRVEAERKLKESCYLAVNDWGTPILKMRVSPKFPEKADLLIVGLKKYFAVIRYMGHPRVDTRVGL